MAERRHIPELCPAVCRVRRCRRPGAQMAGPVEGSSGGGACRTARLLRDNSDPRIRELIQQVDVAQKDLTRSMQEPPRNADPADWRRRRESAKSRVAELESALALASISFAELRRVGHASPDDIAAAIPADSALLDYAKIRDIDFKEVVLRQRIQRLRATWSSSLRQAGQQSRQ